MQIGTVSAWDFLVVCTRGGGYCADRDRISLGLLCGLHKGGSVQIWTALAEDCCAVCTGGRVVYNRDRISLGLLCGLHKGGGGGGTVQIATVSAWNFYVVCTRGGGVLCR